MPLEAMLVLGVPGVAAFPRTVPSPLAATRTDARGNHSLILGSLSRVPKREK